MTDLKYKDENSNGNRSGISLPSTVLPLPTDDFLPDDVFTPCFLFPDATDPVVNSFHPGVRRSGNQHLELRSLSFGSEQKEGHAHALFVQGASFWCVYP